MISPRDNLFWMEFTQVIMSVMMTILEENFSVVTIIFDKFTSICIYTIFVV